MENYIKTKVDKQSCWFVMRAYKSEKKAEEVLSGENGLKFFLPKRYAVRTYHGVSSKRLVPVIPSLIFVHATQEQIVEFKKRHNFLQFVVKEGVGRQYLAVPAWQMEDFIKVASMHEENIQFFSPDEIDIKKGARVRIIGGKFNNVTGLFVSVKGTRKRRLVVELEGILAASVEVAPDLVQILPEENK